MGNLSERIFEALLTEFILGFIGYMVGDKFTYLLLLGLGALIAATIAFIPKININFKKSIKQEKPLKPLQVYPAEKLTASKNLQNILLYSQWILTNIAASIAIGTAYTVITSQTSSWIFNTYMVLPSIVGGIIAGLLQWLILRKQFPKSSQWVIVTVIGWGLGVVLEIILFQNLNENTILRAASNGLIVGLLQWLVLRQHFESAKWWILANIVDLVLGRLLDPYLAQLNYNLIQLHYNPLLMVAALSGISTSLCTGIVLVYILRKPIAKN